MSQSQAIPTYRRQLTKAITEAHEHADRCIATAISRGAQTPCCRKGCHACCYEPAYAIRQEVEHALASVPPEKREALKERTSVWLEKLEAGGFTDGEMPDAVAYRKHAIACPFLENGLCSVYDRRPIGCRSFFAIGNPADCELPNRAHQKFACFPPKAMAQIAGPLITATNAGPNDADHIGSLLAELLGLAERV